MFRCSQFIYLGQCYKTYYGRNLRMFVISQSVCLWQAFPVCCNAGAYPIEEHFRCSTLGQALGLAHKQQTRLEKFARDKHSSLLQKFVNYEQKKFYNIGPRSHLSSYFYYLIYRQKFVFKINLKLNFYIILLFRYVSVNDKMIITASDDSTVVERLPHHPKVKGQYPTTTKGRKQRERVISFQKTQKEL